MSKDSVGFERVEAELELHPVTFLTWNLKKWGALLLTLLALLFIDFFEFRIIPDPESASSPSQDTDEVSTFAGIL